LVRPQFVFIDDVVPNEVDASSETILDSIESTIESDIRGGLSGSGYFIAAIGTPFNKSDPIYRRIEEGSMLPVVFPRASKIPTDEVKEEDFESIWPDRHTYKNCRRDYVKAKREEEKGVVTKMRKLMQEHYLRIANEADRLVPDKLIQWFDREDILRQAWAYNWYILTDYTSKRDIGFDLSGAALFAVSHNGDWFMIDLVLKKMGLEEQYLETFRLNSMYETDRRVAEVAVETDGQQDVHIYSLKKMMVARNEYFIFARQRGAAKGKIGIKSKNEKGDKHWRFRTMVPMFENGKIWFADQLRGTPDMDELLEEIKYATYRALNAPHDDGIDLISQIGMVDANLPNKHETRGVAKVKRLKKRGGLGFWRTRELDIDEEPSPYSSYTVG
jgi:phage terminase large subunit-like protein